MFGKKPVESENVNKAVAKAVNYEISIADLARRSERRAWGVAFGAIILCLLLGGGYYYMLPLKEKVPYLVMADAYTGTSTVSVLRNSGDVHSVTLSEALARSNVARFITARESYDSEMMGLNDWDTVFSMAPKDTPVGAEYYTLHNSPSAPYYTYGKERAIRIKILSITLLGGGDGKPYTGANVRFQRSVYEKKTGQSTLLDNKFAIMGFRYNSNLAMEDNLRVLNPLGFQVTDYRVDNDYSAMPVPPSSSPMQSPAGGAVQQPAAGQAPAAAGQVPVAPMPGQPLAPGANGTMTAPQQMPMTSPPSAPVYPGAQPAAAPPAPNAAPQHNGNGANVR